MQQTRQGLSLATFLFLLLGPTPSFGCSLITIPPVDINPREVVFSGKVVEVTNRTSETSIGESLWGVRVGVEEAISLPDDRQRREYVVYPFALGTDCSKVPIPKEWILKEYPPGTHVWVIGDRTARTGASELEVWEGNDGYIILNRKPQTDAESIFNYRRHDVGLLSAIELRKDLVRLRNSRTERAKIKIVKRLAFHPDFKAQEDRFVLLVERHLRDKASIQKVMEFYQREVKGHNPRLHRMAGFAIHR